MVALFGSTLHLKAVVVTLCAAIVGAVIGGVVVYCVLQATSNSSSSSGETSTGSRVSSSLKLVIVVSRHGNRGGYTDYPLDPYPLDNEEYWPYGAAALTPKGRVQAYNLGVKVRSLYNGFLPTRFYSEDIYACSDKSERVVMSGELFLAGLYPPKGFQVWNKDVKWQPIAFYTNSSDRSEYVGSCASLALEKSEHFSLLLENDAENVSAIVNYVYEQTGQNISSSMLSNMFDKLNTEYREGYTLPDWTLSLFNGSLADFALKTFKAQNLATDEMVRLSAGELFEDLIGYMEKKANASLLPDRKIVFFSSHDTTIMALQVALGIPRSKLKIVQAGSAQIVELHQDPDTSQYLVQTLYIDGTSSELEPVSQDLPNCGDPCLLSTFLDVTHNFTDVNFQEECQIFNSSSALIS